MKIFKYFSHILFALALAYFGLLAFVFQKDVMFNQMIMIMIAGFWILWIFAKSLLKMIAAVALVGAMLCAGYYVMHHEEIECKKAGREWNKVEKKCEDKKSMTEKIKNAVADALKSSLKRWKEENIKVEKEEPAEEE